VANIVDVIATKISGRKRKKTVRKKSRRSTWVVDLFKWWFWHLQWRI